ncbi:MULTISPECIES: TetR/AcrR family transcriptional regulator [Nocardia]|uniref:TetR family transcriptional regulator n=2 Tax=Nocardia TaxID=1817 RepID=A0A4R6P5W9_NOCIG|nr:MULTISPECIES: TetR/AcrR family transcriptional regulator [Nocardia]NKX87198.1 TetR/AcrR family transcriptional regulator [Nocardia coubleae]TDP32460.1 TetR family transcriptional regulator [Nocardia ignorata]
MSEEPGSTLRQLPRGRHRLSREEVVASQRERILVAMGEAMCESGYVGTPVAAVLKRAGVSRETFYEQFRSKEDCFRAAFDRASKLLSDRLQDTIAELADADAPTRMDRILTAYFQHLIDDPASARLFLVEVYAAGPAAIAARMDLQHRFVTVVAAMLGAETDEQRFACATLAAAIGAMVTGKIAGGDLDSLWELKDQLIALAQRSGTVYGNAFAG